MAVDFLTIRCAVTYESLQISCAASALTLMRSFAIKNNHLENPIGDCEFVMLTRVRCHTWRIAGGPLQRRQLEGENMAMIAEGLLP
jgi:hypothetical protein